MVAAGGGASSDAGTANTAPVVTTVTAGSLQYGRSATINVAGTALSAGLTVDTGGACTSGAFAAGSSTALVFNCTVAKVGDLAVTVKDATGKALYQATLTVPKPQVALTTNKGVITLELEPALVPLTVNNFLAYVNSGYYSNTLFHRVVAGFVAQGGGFVSGMSSKPGLSAPIALETNKGLSNVRGTVAMARTAVADSATSQFYINLVNNTFLDYQSASSLGYAVFGTVVQGMDVVDAIGAVSTGTLNGYGDVPLTDVTITSAVQIK